METIIAALGDQQAELDKLLALLDEAGWARPSPCPGWSVSDVVLHLAQTDELGAASAQGTFDEAVARLVPTAGGFASAEDAMGAMVDKERGEAGPAVHARWLRAAQAEHAALGACDPRQPLAWVVGTIPARTMATTRLSETWIHTHDVAEGIGATLPATERLWHIARLAWRSLPYAYARSGEESPGPVRVALTAPDGSTWEFAEAGVEPVATIEGPAFDFCLVAGRRRDPAETALVGSGAGVATVLRLLRTYV